MRRILAWLALATTLCFSAPVLAQEGAEVVTAVQEVATQAPVAPEASTVDNGFVMICTALVILMSIPGIALFYGGLVRAKNMLSILVQAFVIFALMYVLWAIYGYSLAFTSNDSETVNQIIGSLDKFLMMGITPETVTGSLSDLTFFSFQGAFAAITACLIIGSFAERIKFSALLFVIVGLFFENICLRKSISFILLCYCRFPNKLLCCFHHISS